MPVWKTAFGSLQKIGKSLMLPVSVLPVAGLLLGLGSAHFAILPEPVSNVMAQAGGAIFGSLPLIFAIGVALGVTNNDGVAALAAVVGYVVLLATMGVVAGLLGYEPKTIMGIPSIETGVFGGILMGGIAGALFNKYFRVKLPPYLGFFAGKRSVPILTACAAVFTGVIVSFVWPPIGRAIDSFSHWAASGSPALAFGIYGIVERSLLPFGLHHIWNVPFFFEVGQYLEPVTGKIIRGEIYRFTAGDPTAGNLAGGYLFKMWGLPAAALAIWQSARPENRAKVGGIMISAALTSFLTGITEPIEFSFLFVAPVLYGIHAVLAGAAYVTCILLGIKHGTTFSHGLVDYVVLFPKSTHGFWYLWLGPLWALMYYTIFRTLIVRGDYKTPGREPEDATLDAAPAPATGSGPAPQRSMAADLVAAFGGRRNIKSLDACITRLRMDLHDPALASESRLKALGASGVMRVGQGMQAIFGTRSENLKTDMEEYMKAAGPEADEPSPMPDRVSSGPVSGGRAGTAAATAVRVDPASLLRALGGRTNVAALAPRAGTRLRVEVRDADAVDENMLLAAGAQAVMRISPGLLHLIVGAQAEELAATLDAPST